MKQESLQSTSWIRRCMRSRQLVRHQLNMHTFERAAMDLPISEWDFQMESREIHWEAVLFCWGLTTATHGACKKRFRAGCCCEYAVSFYILFSLRICWFFGYWRLAEAVADRRLRDLLFPRARLGADCLFCCTRSSCHTSFWLAMPNRPSRRLESQLSQKSRVWRSQKSQMYSLRVKSVKWVNISREFGGCPDLGRRP